VRKMMKEIVTIALISMIVLAMSAMAKTPETITIKAGHSADYADGHLRIKFLSVDEDSRCPVGVNCIWAGNAKIKIEVTGKSSTKTFELNTNLEPQTVMMDCYAIEIESLLPAKDAEKATDQKDYQVKLKIKNLIQ